jgi:hypothetical protein
LLFYILPCSLRHSRTHSLAHSTEGHPKIPDTYTHTARLPTHRISSFLFNSIRPCTGIQYQHQEKAHKDLC